MRITNVLIFNKSYLQKIEEAKETDSMVELYAILIAIMAKEQILETLNDEIFS